MRTACAHLRARTLTNRFPDTLALLAPLLDLLSRHTHALASQPAPDAPALRLAAQAQLAAAVPPQRPPVA